MGLRLIIWGGTALLLFLFYQRQLRRYCTSFGAQSGAVLLTLLSSFVPMGWLLGMVIAYGWPFIQKKGRGEGRGDEYGSQICAKCGTLSKKRGSSCLACNNAYI